MDIASNVNGCALHTYVDIFRAPEETNDKLSLTCHFGEAVSDGVTEYSGMSVSRRPYFVTWRISRAVGMKTADHHRKRKITINA